jgi:integrase
VRRSVARKTISTPKNKKARFHPVPATLIEELQRWMLKTEGQLLFPGPEGGRIPNNTLNRWFTELAAAAGTRVSVQRIAWLTSREVGVTLAGDARRAHRG